MDFSFWIILWIVILIVQNVLDKKKRKNIPPPDSRNSRDFEIPTLANDPTFPNEDNLIFRDEDLGFKGEFKEVKVKDSVVRDKVEQKNSPLDINPDTAMNAIVMSEILGKPKALRKK